MHRPTASSRRTSTTPKTVGNAGRRTRARATKPSGKSGSRKETWNLSYENLYRASPLDRIALIRDGIPASEVKNLFSRLRIGQATGFKALNLSTATVNKKAKTGDRLSSGETERIIGFARLIGQVEAMIAESGDPTGFDAGAWLARWIMEPVPALGGARPADLIDTMEGQALVAATLAKIQSGAYA